MKSKNDLFNEKMPSALRSRILSEADSHLKENAAIHRKTFLAWIFGAGVAAALASFSFVFFRQQDLNHEHQVEVAQSVDLFEDFQNEDDFEMLANYELIENLDLIDPLEDET